MTRKLGLLGAVVLAAGLGYFALNTSTPGSTELTAPIGAASASEVDTSSVVEMSIGQEDAPVTIVEYASFTCPHCAAFHQDGFKRLKADYIDTGKVKLVYHDVYFDKYGLWASMIARCGGPEKFFGIADLLYKGQSTWARAAEPNGIVEELKKIGRLAGIENDKLEACMTDKTMAETLVAWFQENAEKDKINATPSFIVNGQLVKNMPYDEFKAVIDAELAK
ncbi:DsbA family protein [Seohaeicola zhoushanensis]|uniref:Thiol-disulfide oxidoreductase n=1 Tax=Seohaeicola zhoushanensis TaxID=1569283 RepID=A0A8J3M545_9RHOB|nr:DsbA family protein [Seohaeicola zhoushanensis]GHF41548.1 thiol-disulfide oxidoreductase [Seohaeicola zhoushanensis]